MKIWLTSDNVDWDTSRYHYAAEQMMLTLFPGEKPEYPEDPPPRSMKEEKNAVILTLHRGKKLANMSALVFRENGWHSGAARFPGEKLDESEERVYHTVQRAVKRAFYNAGSALLGHDLPWGSLTGVRPTKLPTKALWEGATPAQAERELVKTYRASPDRAKLAVACAEHSVRAKKSLGADEISLYVGVPFCPTRCSYCSFISADVHRALSLVEPYVAALMEEVAALAKAVRRQGSRVRTLYFGGGTPTTLSPELLDRLLTHLERELDLSHRTEYTVEAGRPDTITAEKLAVLAAHGVDRISINPQSMEDRVLAAIGRSHTAADIERAYALARQTARFDVNMDLIAGLPADTLPGFRATLTKVLALAPENITVHTLALKKGSALTQTAASLPAAETVAGMLDEAWTALAGAGYRPYYLYRQKYMSGGFENVGWCRPGKENLYNICMMEELHTVLSLGCGGVSKLIDRTKGSLVRVSNPKYPQEYIKNIAEICRQKEELTWPMTSL